MAAHELSHLYQQLTVNHHNQEIRVLDLLPGSWSSPLKCNIRIVRLHESPAYQALSYTWGGDEAPHVLLINGKYEIKSRKNLYSALRRLRRRWKKITIWADAICIDQSNLTERSEQVTLMGDVYAKAASVLVWIGEPSTNISTTSPILDSTRTANGMLKAHAAALESAIANSTPRWCERQWIIQEFVLAKKAYLCFGEVCMEFSSAAMTDFVMSSAAVGMPNLRTFHESTSDMMKLRIQLEFNEHGIAEAATWTSGGNATDPRDKVFSLLGMVHPQEAEIIGSDYTMSQEVVFARATYASLVVQGNFDILRHVDFGSNRPRSLPSWAVNFADENLSTVPGGLMLHNSIQLPENRDNAAAKVELQDDGMGLKFSGVPLDRIAYCLHLPAGRNDKANLPFAQQILDFLQTACKNDTFPDTKRHDIKLDKQQVLNAEPIVFLPRWPRDTLVIVALRTMLTWWDSISDFFPLFRDPANIPAECPGRRRRATDPLGLWDHAARAAGAVSLVLTDAGFLGLMPVTVSTGDEVVLVKDSAFALVLRKGGRLEFYRFRGLGYVHGIANGELIEYWKDGMPVERKYILC